MIPESLIEEIKEKINISDIISDYVKLEKSGLNLKGLCPFHSEKNPSFYVYNSTGRFYCFGCGASGDIISFIMHAENLNYVEAVGLLARRAGLNMEEWKYDHTNGVSRSRLHCMNYDAACFFRDQLKLSDSAKDHLKRRGISSETADKFMLGYAPCDNNATYDYLKKLSYSNKELFCGYICRKNRETETVSDIFCDRLIIPIKDPEGNIIAFSGRSIGDTVPKYINSANTPAFKKSRCLFGIDIAKRFCRDELILCEGYFDVITLHAADFKNAVASLGTSLTTDHVSMIRRYTQRVILAFDSDTAGQAATKKALKLFHGSGLDVKILNLGEAKDPDEYIRKFGAESFGECLRAAKTEFEYKYDTIMAQNDIKTLDGKIKATSELVELLSEIPSAVERDIYASFVSEKTGIEKKAIESDVNRIMVRNEYDKQPTIE